MPGSGSSSGICSGRNAVLSGAALLLLLLLVFSRSSSTPTTSTSPAQRAAPLAATSAPSSTSTVPLEEDEEDEEEKQDGNAAGGQEHVQTTEKDIRNMPPVPWESNAKGDALLAQELSYLAALPEPVKRPRLHAEDATDMEANGLYPRIIGIGCQKCGTGALAVYLASLRNFHKPVTKEIHAFRGDRVFTQVAKDPVTAGPNALVRSLEWYGREWNVSAGLSIHCDAGPPVRCRGNAEPGHVPFEITPRYLSDLRVPYNMQQQLPHIAGVKLVVILRHPTPRAWSAFFQTARPPMWRRDTFVDHVREEVRLLRRCYNSSMAFALLAADTMGHRPTRLGADHIRATACREPIAAYRALQRCVQAHVRDPDEAWFLKYSQAYSEMPRQFGVLEEAPFQGNVVRGFYVDNFVNLLCAGFRPEDVLVLTQGELRANATHVAERVAHHAGVPFEIAEPKWFTQGVSKQHKSVGTIPEEVVPLLNELYAPYNDMLLKLLLSNAFPMDRLAVLREFGEYVPPPPPPPAELAEINDEMNAAAEAASLKAEERLRQSEKQRKGSREVASNKKPKARNVPVPDI